MTTMAAAGDAVTESAERRDRKGVLPESGVTSGRWPPAWNHWSVRANVWLTMPCAEALVTWTDQLPRHLRTTKIWRFRTSRRALDPGSYLAGDRVPSINANLNATTLPDGIGDVALPTTEDYLGAKT